MSVAQAFPKSCRRLRVAVGCMLGAWALLGQPRAAMAHPPPITMNLSLLGNPILYREGVEQPYWFVTGWGLEETFRGVPEAEALAREYQFWATTGNTASVVGSAMFMGAAWYRVDRALPRGKHAASWAIFGTGALISFGGGFIAQKSKKLIFQAVNVFNASHDFPVQPSVHTGLNDSGQVEGRFLLDFPLGSR